MHDAPEAGARRILHVDMDAFYASVEQRDNPELRGQPLVVGGGGKRGVVAAASYESRQFGIRSAMPMREARRRCPDLKQVKPRMRHYQAISRQVFDIFRDFTPLVEGLSLDEAFLDVTSSASLFGDSETIARAVKTRIQAETGLKASVGAAPNKLVAKIASDLDKPDGLVVIDNANLRATLDPLPVEVIPGIGRVTLGKLRGLGIATIHDLRLATDTLLDPVFGRYTTRMRARARGEDDRPVSPQREDKSISAEQTFDTDLDDRPTMDSNLLGLTEKASGRMRTKGLIAATVQIKIRQADFQTFTRQRRMKPPGNSVDQIYSIARDLLSHWLQEHPGQKIRLLGVGGSDFSPAVQQDLFAESGDRPVSELDRTVDDIRERFGTSALGRARALKNDQIR